MKEIELPQMTNHYFMPWFPLPQTNLTISGKLREDLPDDAQVHYWYGHWTRKELYKYGALPPKDPEYATDNYT